MDRRQETALVVTRHGQPLREPQFVVRVMARAEGYAMVRRPGCAPFLLLERDLQPLALKAASTPATLPCEPKEGRQSSQRLEPSAQ